MVIGIFFDVKEGKITDNWLMEDFDFEKVTDPGVNAVHKFFMKQLDMTSFFSKLKNQRIFNYEGSLTTPGCSEVVNWVVVEQPVFISPRNFKVLLTHMGTSNRNTQPLGTREVKVSVVASISVHAFSFTSIVLCLSLMFGL
jgi:carbonic anhydrase